MIALYRVQVKSNANSNWLDSRHVCFYNYCVPNKMEFASLRQIDEDLMQLGKALDPMIIEV